MSRRTKLIIATLFLILLSIVVTGLVLSWHPQNPLRFTLATEQPTAPAAVPSGRLRGGVSPFYVTVENISNTTVALFYAEVRAVSEDFPKPRASLGTISTDEPFASDPLSEGRCWLIPPRGTARCAVTTLPGYGLRDVQSSVIEVRYTWYSRTKLRVGDTLGKIGQSTLSTLKDKDWYWNLFPESGEDITPLQPAPAPAAAPALPPNF